MKRDSSSASTSTTSFAFGVDTIRRLGSYRSGFRYVWAHTGDPVRDAATLAHIDELKVPPAYLDVEINGNRHATKLMAIGNDVKGRRQMIYSATHVRRQATKKFSRCVKLRPVIHALYRNLRRRLRHATENSKSNDIDAVLFLTIECGFRIGNERYRKANKSFGLTTLERRHTCLDRSTRSVQFSFPGKEGVVNESTCSYAPLYRYMRLKLDHLPSSSTAPLFACSSDDVNDFLKTVDPDLSCKDLRTWNANELFRDYMRAHKREAPTVKDAIDHVAQQLHHTSSICKKSYIDPQLIAKYS